LVKLTGAGRRLRESAAEVPASLMRQLELRIDDLEHLRDAVQAFVASLCGKDTVRSTENQEA
ncbi:MAG TPA: MarR family transcriptional regulator, partial [Gammaproteobacteria bacterium]|nr:MarR family transcriptional regulator [Gammaproteobacteria bacterium]